jgi:hypothetical protein
MFHSSPTHLAAYHGKLEILRRLLHFSGDPWILDGFGRSIQDWASTYPEDLQAKDILHGNYKRTDRDVSLRHMTQTIQIVLQCFQQHPSWFNQLGCLLLQIGEESEATTALEQTILYSQSDEIIGQNFNCDMRRSSDTQHPLEGKRYHCRTCADTDICERCFIKYDNKGVKNCRGHGFLVIPSPTWKNLQPPFIDTAGETRENWIERLRRQWDSKVLEIEAHRDGMEIRHDV